MAGVALANALNANQVLRWMREHGVAPPSRLKPVSVERTTMAELGFVPVQVGPRVSEAVIRLEVQRGHARLKVEWPVEAVDACGAWLREWLA